MLSVILVKGGIYMQNCNFNTKIFPGNFGENCPGNGKHKDIECLCDECDYLMCCTQYKNECENCNEDCPNAGKHSV